MDSPLCAPILSISPNDKVSVFVKRRRAPADQIGYDDVLRIADLSVDSFLKNIRIRYQNGIYYTYIGDVCVSVNPNRSDLDYSHDVMQIYHGKHLHESPPHIFAIAGSAYQQTFEHNNDSCVIITGESGSGKTEASKLLLLFITHIVKMKEQIGQASGMVQHISQVESVLLNSNCILEAFGNARTLRNLNSSRFGKYIDIYFKRNPKWSSNFTNGFALQREENLFAVIHSYMLEKSRVIAHQSCERNFHVFYQLLASLDDQESDHYEIISQLALYQDPSQYAYLKNSMVTDHDRDECKKVVKAMQSVGFDAQEKKTVFHIIAAILHLGNVDFESIEIEREHHGGHITTDQEIRVKAQSTDHLEHFCRLLSLDLANTKTSLCTRQIRTRNEVMRKTYRLIEAVHGRNALAKALYERAFYFILERINRSLANKLDSTQATIGLKSKTIGILDLYGFEVFSGQPNMFEQFLVNYCNEKLHQVFVDVILNKEQMLYDREDINWQMVDFENNLAICELMDEQHRGMFPLLDEACTTGSNTDDTLLEEFNRRFAKNDHYCSRRLNHSCGRLTAGADFAIRHYAGEVHYSIRDFIHKNMDLLYVDYKQLIYSSDNALIKEMWKDGKLDEDCLPSRMPITSALEYRKSMADLIARLTSKRHFFIRCIKPNEELTDQVDQFNDDKVAHQIKYLGLVSLGQVRKAGFLNRFTYMAFVQRYRMLYYGKEFDFNQLHAATGKQPDDQRPIYQSLCSEIIDDNLPFSSQQRIAFGKTLIFFRDLAIVDCLEEKRDKFLERIVLEMQTFSRSKLAKQRWERKKQAQVILKKFAHLKKVKFMWKVAEALQEYEHELRYTCENTPLLEYRQLFLFQWPDMPRPRMAKNDRLLSTELPKLGAQLNTLLIILKFPCEYWVDKLLRMDACKIFWAKKADWGETRRRWLGNYLTSASECSQHDTFKTFFNANSATFGKVHFTSYLLKTNARNLEQIRAIVMTDTALYKVNIDDLTFSKWLSIKELASVSLTPDSDQLVVLHAKASTHGDNDLVFSFYSNGMSESFGGISSTQLSFNDSKVGEFVALLCQQYQAVTGTVLQVNFSKQIKFRFGNEPHTIQVKPFGQASEETALRSFSEAILYNFWKRLRGLYLRFQPNLAAFDYKSTHELRNKRIDFEMISRHRFVLIYNK